MIIRKLEDSRLQGRMISDKNWVSHRLILKDDNVGFSFHITYIHKDSVLDMHYKNHIESVYCIAGKGQIENRETGAVFPINPGTLYVLDKHDKHRLTAIEELQLACVFNPPLVGHEVHDAEGAYSLPE